jgi:hypothetical protein
LDFSRYEQRNPQQFCLEDPQGSIIACACLEWVENVAGLTGAFQIERPNRTATDATNPSGFDARSGWMPPTGLQNVAQGHHLSRMFTIKGTQGRG